MHRIRNNKRLFIRLILAIYWAKILTLFRPFKSIAMSNPSKGTEIDNAYSEKVKTLLHTAEKFCFWNNKCLTYVIAIRKIYNAKNLKSEAFLSVRDRGEFYAHAGIKSNGIEIVENLKGYVVLYTF